MFATMTPSRRRTIPTEHDYGAFDHPQAGKVIWQIDYYDPSFTQGSEDPLDAAKTCRVLTILLAEEW